ncbi:MAG: peptidoglycan DD-metalloendopeptidase family protein, partial [Patescibacteria group bacterium]
TPTPIPGPVPFLDLPWDYEGKGLTFNEAVLNPSAWFDHKYPLQNVSCCIKDIVDYTGEIKILHYKSHNGYDYSLKNGVTLNTPVLAAASGIATFKSAANSGGAGNIIKIDHGNGYQTWYEHLSNDDLVVSTEGVSVSVAKGQMIGRVGMTGNTTGPHIHFSVFKDANGNGTLDDDYPYGVVDPLGWEGEDTDPWIEWSDGIRTGIESFNLFIPRKAPKSTPVPPSGAIITIDDVQIAVPSGALIKDFTLTIKNGPFEFVLDTLKSIVPSFFLDAVDSLGQKVTEFLEPIQITYSYKDADLFNINEDTLKLYFFNDQTSQWEALSSIFLDKDSKTITAETTHLSHFALMGEVKDNVAPTTDIILSGDKGEDNWYRSSVNVELNAKDNNNGVGLQYTLYTVNGEDWFEYKDSLVFDNEGTHNITYQSIDRAENTEERKTITFYIDKTTPEAKLFADQATKDLIIEALDNNPTTVEKQDKASYVIADLAGNRLLIDLKDKSGNKDDDEDGDGDEDEKEDDEDDDEGKNKVKLVIKSLQYNSDEPILLPKNSFVIKYKDKKKQDLLFIKKQEFEIKKEIKIKIKYDSSKNQSLITTKPYKEKKSKETRNGFILLQLTTEKGTLKYSY